MPVVDRWTEFLGELDMSVDAALGLMSSDIERLAKQIAPVKTGELYASGSQQRVGTNHWIVSFGDEGPSEHYAAYQEAGERADGTYQVHNYTKPGTGAHFLAIAGDNVALQAPGAFATSMAPIGRGLL